MQIEMEFYESVNAMIAQLGADGTISAGAPEVNRVMNALYDIDGGSPPNQTLNRTQKAAPVGSALGES